MIGEYGGPTVWNPYFRNLVGMMSNWQWAICSKSDRQTREVAEVSL